MLIRPFQVNDLESVRAIHAAQRLGYEMPKFDEQDFIIKAVIEEAGEIHTALFLRKTAEAYLLMKRAGRKEGIQRLIVLNREINPIARRMGLPEVFCMCPPQLEGNFGKLLLHMGWRKQLWSMFSKEVI